jgi:hypothetical protein
VRKILPAFVLMCLFVVGSKVLPQSPNGSIRGIVLDPDSKAIPDAEVIAVNDATRLQYETKTNGEGIYAVENLPPGPYRLQVSKFGFKAIIKPDITINVQDSLVLNFALEVGASSVVVTVEGGAPLINTTDASVSTVIDREFAENLPMNGRSFQTLIYLTPGVVVTATNTQDNGQFSVNGQRASANYWTVDGVSANVGLGANKIGGANGLGGTIGSFSALGGTNSLVSVDALQEFRIQTSTFAPEFGRTPGGQIAIVTRSGTDQFHGTVFDYFRNDALDANDWFNGYVTPKLPKARERQNDFGGTLSGPIAKDKAFFFFSYEGLRLQLPQTSLTTVPDLASRQAAVPAMQPYLNAFPAPNGTDDPATGIAEFNSSYSNPASLDAYSLRIDHKLGNGWTLFGRYNYSPSQSGNRGNSGSSPLSINYVSRITTQTGTLAIDSTLSPAVTNDLRFNYSRTNASSSSTLDNFGGAVPIATFPFPSPYNTQNAYFSVALFNLSEGFGLNVGHFNQIIQKQYNLVDNVSVQRGGHTLKFGVDYRRLSPFMAPAKYQQTWSFFGDMQSVEAGEASSANVNSLTNATLLFRNLGAYAQDTWHAWPRLTVTYGLRWDVDFTPSSVSGPNIPAVTGYNLRDLSQLAVAPQGTAPFRTRYGNVAPRLGAAYELNQAQNWQTIVRGGFGVFYDLVDSEAGNLLLVPTPPFGQRTLILDPAVPLSASQSAPPIIPSVATLSEINVFNPNLKLPYTLQWNVSFEQELAKNQSLTVSYVGAIGRRLLQSTEVFGPPTNPEISTGLFVDNSAVSNYQALQLQFRRRLSNGLQGIASYTWSHSIDTASAGSFGSISNANDPSDPNANRGNSDFDIRHAITAGITYEIPEPRIKSFAKEILKGWSTDSFILARTAPPVDVSDSNFFETQANVYVNIRPDVVPGEPFYIFGKQCIVVFGVTCPGGKGLNPAAFTNPPADPVTLNPLRQGDLPRNFLRGFGAAQWDFAVHRDFFLRENWKIQFRAEMFNVLNHPNFGPPNNQFGLGGFGLSTETLAQSLSAGSQGMGGFSPLYQIGGPRSIQLALKLVF